MELFVALVVMLTMPQVDLATQEYCDVLEVNVVYDEKGREILRQLIGWDKSESPNGFSVVFWRLITQESMYPQLSYATQMYSSEWHDGDTFRRVKSSKRWVRHLQYDVEIFDRRHMPKEHRRGLTTPRHAQGGE